MEFEHFDHGADVGVRGFGATPAEAFEGAARALFLLLCEDLSEVRGQIEEPIACDAATLEELLVAYLNELIFLSDSRGFVLGRFEVRIAPAPGGFRLSGRAWGEPFDRERHEFHGAAQGGDLHGHAGGARGEGVGRAVRGGRLRRQRFASGSIFFHLARSWESRKIRT